MAVEIGIDALPVRIKRNIRGENKEFTTVVGIAIVTDKPKTLKSKYESELKNILREEGIESSRTVLSSYEILTHTKGDLTVHKKILHNKILCCRIKRILYPTVRNSMKD